MWGFTMLGVPSWVLLFGDLHWVSPIFANPHLRSIMFPNPHLRNIMASTRLAGNSKGSNIVNLRGPLKESP